METSILRSVKDAVGVNPDDTVFDDELLMHINSTFLVLKQLGVGQDELFSVTGDSAVWTDFQTKGSSLPMVKTYVTLRVKSLFDPPTSSSLSTALKETITEYEWRLSIEEDDYKIEEDEKYASRLTSS